MLILGQLIVLMQHQGPYIKDQDKILRYVMFVISGSKINYSDNFQQKIWDFLKDNFESKNKSQLCLFNNVLLIYEGKK